MNLPERESTNKEVFLDFLKEVTGYEHGLGRTFIDLRKKPNVVLNSYLNKEPFYVSPFRLLFAALGLWLFISSFIINWHAEWYDLTKQIFKFFFDDVFHIPPEKQLKSAELIENFARGYSNFFGDLFAKFYVPFVIAVLPLTSWIGVKFCKEYNVPFRTILVANTYSVATSTFLIFFMSVGFVLNAMITTVIAIILLGLSLMGHNLIQLTPLRNFFPENGVKIEKKILTSNLIAVAIVMSLFGAGYFLIMYVLK